MTAMAQISNEYAEALFALALETGSVKEYSEALDIVLNLMKENPEYIDFLSSPEDTNLKPNFANFLRGLRLFAVFITFLRSSICRFNMSRFVLSGFFAAFWR